MERDGGESEGLVSLSAVCSLVLVSRENPGARGESFRLWERTGKDHRIQASRVCLGLENRAALFSNYSWTSRDKTSVFHFLKAKAFDSYSEATAEWKLRRVRREGSESQDIMSSYEH